MLQSIINFACNLAHNVGIKWQITYEENKVLKPLNRLKDLKTSRDCLVSISGNFRGMHDYKGGKFR